ncbi:MAG: LptF/LptG family permease [Bacteroidales bacterium]|nr:LptF/LptG family permease [Bacteroidales bacterium]
MRKLHILVIRSYLGPLVMTFFIALFILLMQFLWKYIDDLVGKGLEWYIIAELLFYASSTFVPLALPLAVLLSSIMTFGNLGEHYELVAMKASGISLRKIMLPLIVVSVAISVFAFLFSNNVLPVANLKFKSLLYDVRQQKLALNIKEGVFYNGIENFVIRVGQKDPDGQTIHDVMIYNHSDQLGNTRLTTAQSGKMRMTADQHYLQFTLFDGIDYQEKTDQRSYRKTRPFQITHFGETVRYFDLGSFALNRTDEVFFKSNYQMMNMSQLQYTLDSLQRDVQKRYTDFPGMVASRSYHLSRCDTIMSVSKTLPGQLIAKANQADKKRIIEEAIAQATANREFVFNSKEDWKSREETLYKHQIAWHQKLSLSFACLVFFFIGAPLGAIIRKGGLGLPVVISTLLFITYHIISITFEKYTRAGLLPAWQGMWIASMILLPVGVFLTRKATLDSPLLDMESWNRFMKKIFPEKIEKWVNRNLRFQEPIKG